ncbi:amidohydrolase family protein [Streptomyces chartreusis]
MGKRTLIRGGYVATMDPELGNLVSGDVLIDGDTIAAVGQNIHAEGAEIVDAAGKLVIPGMVDTHRHTWQTQMRGICADMSLLEYMNTIRLAISPNYEPDDVRLGNQLGALEAINAGVTTILDFSHCNNSPEHADAAVTGLVDSGIRALFSYGFFDSSPSTTKFVDHEARLADFRRIFDTYTGTPRITFGVSLTEIGLIPWEHTVAEIRTARELGARIALHTGCVWGSAVTGGIKELHHAGLLGPDQVHIHANTLDEEEWTYLGRAGAHVSISPETELNMGMGWPVFEECRAHGIKPTLSCDVISLNSGSLVTQMRLGIAADRFAQNDPINRANRMPHSVQTQSMDALGWATINGAAACGLDDVIGSLTVGKKADVVVVGNAESFTGQPAINPVGSLVFQSTPNDVSDVFIDGRHVKRNGKLVGVDLPDLFAQSNASTQRVLDEVAKTYPQLPPPMQGSNFEALEEAAAANLAAAPKG